MPSGELLFGGSTNDSNYNPLLTPNNDGFNDVLFFDDIDLSSDNEIIIFNRYGDEVFWAKPYMNDWKGTYNNMPLLNGTYYYYLTSEDGKQTKGYITILTEK